jgi:hypothetical protein
MGKQGGDKIAGGTVAVRSPTRTRVVAKVSNSRNADRTARSCASTIRSSAMASTAMETDFGGENVKS